MRKRKLIYNGSHDVQPTYGAGMDLVRVDTAHCHQKHHSFDIGNWNHLNFSWLNLARYQMVSFMYMTLLKAIRLFMH